MASRDLILLDTHIWVWWVHGDARLASEDLERLDQPPEAGLGLSIISCWEVAKLVERGRLSLPHDLEDWFALALGYPDLRVLNLTPQIIAESTSLPGSFHRDPADQLIVATARVHRCRLATSDLKLIDYEHIDTLKMGR